MKRDERGQSLTVLVAVSMVGLLTMGGLVIDGGRQSAATRRAEVVAADAARAAIDYSATRRLAGQPADPGAATQVALARLRTGGDVTAEVTWPDPDRVRVETRIDTPTIFLSLIGRHTMTSRGSAEASLVNREAR